MECFANFSDIPNNFSQNIIWYGIQGRRTKCVLTSMWKLVEWRGKPSQKKIGSQLKLKMLEENDQNNRVQNHWNAVGSRLFIRHLLSLMSLSITKPNWMRALFSIWHLFSNIYVLFAIILAYLIRCHCVITVENEQWEEEGREEKKWPISNTFLFMYHSFEWLRRTRMF